MAVLRVMRLFRTPDPVDAVLGDEPTDADLADVAATVHELRATYLPSESPARSEALTAFTSVGVPGVARSASPERTIPMRKTVAAFAATITGKIVLGTAVAAASVGGAAAAGVNVPVLPDTANSNAVVQTAERPDRPEQAGEGQGEGEATTEETHDAGDGGPSDQAFGAAAEGEVPEHVRTYLDRIEAWVHCVRDATATQAGENDPEFDLQDQCADTKPGGDAAPGQANAEQGQANAEQGQTNAEQGQANAEQGKANAEQGKANAEQGQANAEDEGEADLESTDDGPSAEGQSNAEQGKAHAPTEIPAGERP